MRKGRDGGETEKNGEKTKTRKKEEEKTDDYSGHYVIPAVDCPNANRWTPYARSIRASLVNKGLD